jgi:multidrug resistance protein, MATE family
LLSSLASINSLLYHKDDPTSTLVGWCVALGGTTALDTLGSQAFTGATRKTDLGIHFQRCVLLLWILLIPVSILWALMEPVLLALGQPPFLAFHVQRFLRVLIVGAPGYVGFESMKKYLQCQGMIWVIASHVLCSSAALGIMGASTTILAIVSPINIGLNIVLIHYTSLGLLGSPLAVSITYWLCFAFLAIYTYFSPIHRENRTWGGIQLRTVLDFKSCYEFLRLALPGILMVGTEW